MESSFILNPLVALAGIGAYYTIPNEVTTIYIYISKNMET